MSGGGGCGKFRGYAEEVVGTVEKFGEGMVEWAWGVELLSPRGRMSGLAAGCPGYTGRMSGLSLGDEHEELRGGKLQLRTNWWMEKGGEGGES